MELKLKEVAEMLQVSDKTIYRWVKDGKIPCYRINHQYRFHRDEIDKWAQINSKQKGTALASSGDSVNPEIPTETSLLEKVRNGGIYYRVASSDIESAISNSVDIIKIPTSLERAPLLDILLKREAMAPTAIGNGIAFPHPREQIVPAISEESVSICFLETSVDGYALDSEPVHTLIIILSATPETHLRILSRLSFLCRDEKFISLLKKSASREEIFNYIEEFEAKTN